MAGERFCSAVWAQETATIQLFPSPGIILQNPQQTFRWDTISGVDFFEIQIGSEVGVSDIYSQSLTDETVVTVKEIPLTGAPLYVRLWWKKDGMWEFADFKYATVKADAGAGGAGAAAENYVTVESKQEVKISVTDKQETQAHIVSSRSVQQNSSTVSSLQQDHQEETTISLQAKSVSTVVQPSGREATTASAATVAIQQEPVVSTQTINFKEGYNYFSVYVVSSMTVGEIIDAVGLTQRIFYWNGSKWAGVNPNETLLPRVGYVVLAEKPGSVELSGEQSKEYILDLKKGWNLVGAPSSGVKQAELLPYDVMQGPVWGWGAGAYVTTEDLQAGQSYWIYAKYDTQLTISRKGNKSKPQIFVKNIEYNATGQMTRIEYGNGVITEYTYNPLTLRLDRIHTINAKGEAIQDFKYRYDSAGNILEIEDDVNTASQSFRYDEQNRLIEANGEYYGLKSFVYDKIGNIVKKDGLSYVYGENGAGPHAVTSLSDGTQIRYDANGNMVSKIKGNETWEYGYDAENRLQEVKKNGVKLSEYEYDGDGGRTKKIVYKEGRGPEVTTFIGSLTEESNNRITNFIYVGGKRIAALTNGEAVFYHDDHLGGVNVITDDKGAKKELIEYLPYGKKSHDEKYGDTKEVAWHYFTGHREDDETGLYYFGARYYDPELGRFITPDDIVPYVDNPQAFNRYSYAGNNPVSHHEDGHGWWKSVKNFFSKWGGLFGMAGGLINGIVNQDWSLLQAQATSFATGFMFGGPIGGMAAMMTTSVLSTPPGQQLTRFTANEIFDDMFGVNNPKTAYILSYTTLSIAGNYGFERAFANLTAEPGKVVDFDPNNPKHIDLLKGEKYGYNSYGGGPDPTNPEATANWAVYGHLKVIEGKDGNMALVGARQWNLGSVHTGANSPNFPKALNMNYPSNLPRNLQGFTFGWCHQASNATLLASGFSNVVTQTSGNYSTFLTTALYGNYGGGLMIKANSVYEAYNNWEKGRQ